MRANGKPLETYLMELKEGQHRFENVFQSLDRMLFQESDQIKPIVVNGQNTYDFLRFRSGKKHIFHDLFCLRYCHA